MKQYHSLLRQVLNKGSKRTDRTGTGTISLFGTQSRYDIQDSFPLLTTKETHFKSIAHELIWFLNGNTNIKYLQDNNVKIWNEWADSDGELGKVYGYQWRNFNGNTDQISNIIHQIKHTPDSRRIIVSAWNPSEINQMALPPCHTLFQFYVEGDYLSCQLYQRSADLFLGVPFNIASYALLTYIIAKLTNKLPKEFIHTIGDAHIYTNHIPQVKQLLKRKEYPLPKLLIKDIKSFENLSMSDFELLNYISHPKIKAKVAV